MDARWERVQYPLFTIYTDPPERITLDDFPEVIAVPTSVRIEGVSANGVFCFRDDGTLRITVANGACTYRFVEATDDRGRPRYHGEALYERLGSA